MINNFFVIINLKIYNMKNSINPKSLFSLLFLTITGVISYGQANVNLSNLSTTSINQNLLPSNNNNKNLGSTGKSWKDVYLDGNVWLDDVIFMTNRNIATGTFLGNSAGNSTTGSNNTGVGYQSLFANTFGSDNTGIGIQSLFSNTSGSYNSAAGRFALYSNTVGNFNTGMGTNALYANTSGSNNTGSGYQSLNWNTTGSYNTAIGLQSLFNNTTASNNVAVGHKTLFTNTTGEYNSATGAEALYSNSVGNYNTANGYKSLYSNSTGSNNSATGYLSLSSNSTGSNNTALGYNSLLNNATGYQNTSIGSISMQLNVTGNANVGVGYGTLYYNEWGNNNTATGYYAGWGNIGGNNNTATGYFAIENGEFGIANTATGAYTITQNEGHRNVADGAYSGEAASFYNNCTLIGYDADHSVTTADNSTALGNGSRITDYDQVRIGNSSITSIGGFEDWTNVSDGRMKKNVKEDVPGLEFITKLRPVTYNLDVSGIRNFLGEDIIVSPGTVEAVEASGQKLDMPAKPEWNQEKEKINYTGFIAQEVEATAEQIGYDFSGVDKPNNENSLYGIRYAQFVVPLVKAVQELDEINKELQIENADIKKRLEKLESLLLNNSTSENISTKNVILTAVDQPAILEQNIPNPFNGKTIIKYFVPENFTSAEIRIQNMNGVELQVVDVASGSGLINLDATEIPSGSYTYSLIIDGRVMDTKTMLLAK